MGQLLSQQAASVRPQRDRNQRISHSRRSSSEQPLYDGPSNVARTISKTGRRDVRDLSRTHNTTSSAQINKSNPHALRTIDGNIGVPRRQQKYGRSKTLKKDTARTHQHKSESNPTNLTLPNLALHPLDPRHSQSQSSPHLTKHCLICLTSRSLHHFPSRPPTAQCTHPIDTCRRCLRAWIASEFSVKIWNEISCPICFKRMKHADIRTFAPSHVFRRYVSFSPLSPPSFKKTISRR
jgi:hypothetical protein